ncbi:hypothetical protein NOI24_29950, partial [Neorhizobium galegae]
NKQAVIAAAAAGIAALAKAMRSHLLPLGVRQDSPNHLQTPQKELESQNRNDQNPDTQQTLVSGVLFEQQLRPAINASLARDSEAGCFSRIWFLLVPRLQRISNRGPSPACRDSYVQLNF